MIIENYTDAANPRAIWPTLTLLWWNDNKLTLELHFWRWNFVLRSKRR